MTVIPGLAALALGGNVRVGQISCARTGECVAVGDYSGANGADHVFVADEVGGKWRQAKEVPGLRALTGGHSALEARVDCPAPGSCTLAGNFVDRTGQFSPFVDNEKRGVWGNAVRIAGYEVLNLGKSDVPWPAVDSLDCWGVANCVIGGYFIDHSSRFHSFVASEVRGRWSHATEVPGLSKFNDTTASKSISIATGISCVKSGYCALVGVYTDASGNLSTYVDSATLGDWESARPLPNIASLGKGKSSLFPWGISCSSSGNCAAGGSFSGDGLMVAFVATEFHGKWSRATLVRGVDRLTSYEGGRAEVQGISCTLDGDCSAVGVYYTSVLGKHALFVDEVKGVWGKASRAPGIASLEVGGESSLSSVSCSSPGNCVAGGSIYTGRTLDHNALLISELRGKWGTPVILPGFANLAAYGDAEVSSVSCSPDGGCGVAGYFDSGGASGVMTASTSLWLK